MKNSLSKWSLLLGISACAICCTLPIIGSIVGFAAIASLGVWFEKAGIVLIGLGAMAFFIAQIKKLKSRTTNAACATDCSCNPANDIAKKEPTLLKQ